MKPYRVKVEAFVVVPARTATDAKARAELALRKAVVVDYLADQTQRWADAWEGFGFRARGAERYEDGSDE